MIQNHQNYKPERHEGERNFLPSRTVPDQSMTIQEILSRFARGLSTTGERVPVYSGEDDDLVPANYEQMDFFEKQEVVENNREIVERLKTQFESEEKERQAAFIEKQKAGVNFSNDDQRDISQNSNINPNPTVKLPAEGVGGQGTKSPKSTNNP